MSLFSALLGRIHNPDGPGRTERPPFNAPRTVLHRGREHLFVGKETWPVTLPESLKPLLTEQRVTTTPPELLVQLPVVHRMAGASWRYGPHIGATKDRQAKPPEGLPQGLDFRHAYQAIKPLRHATLAVDFLPHKPFENVGFFLHPSEGSTLGDEALSALVKKASDATSERFVGFRVVATRFGGDNAPRELNDLTHYHVADKHGVPVIAEAEGRKMLTSGTAEFMGHLIALLDEKPAEGWKAT